MRRHVARWVIQIGVLVGMFLAASAALAQDTVDLSAAGFSIPMLTAGARLEGALTDSISARLYGFQGSAGDVVSITMTQGSARLDPFLVLFGADGTVIASDDDSGAATILSAAIDGVTLPYDGAYLILATSLEHIHGESTTFETRTFSLALNGITPPAGGSSIFEVLAQPLVPGTAVSADIAADQMGAFFLLRADVGSAFDVIVPDANFDTVLHLFDSTGARVAVNDDDESRVTLTSGIYDVTAAAAERVTDLPYLAVVTDVFFYVTNADRAAEVMPQFEGGSVSVVMQAG
ncbi:MAG: PPC domain-containing protein [Anaerolineae bacterium]|nr:PPC domain-containing protein [Anaerolineae bacterium]NUQ06239.1 PPC domain-containing protein [Anaerolineae bacterium]